MQVAGCRLQDAGCRMQVAGCRLHVAGYRDTGYLINTLDPFFCESYIVFVMGHHPATCILQPAPFIHFSLC